MRPVALDCGERTSFGARLVSLLVVQLLLISVVSACGTGQAAEETPQGLAGMVRSPVANVADVSLPAVSHGGADFSMRAADGHLLVVYFGYTSCPDICPTTMADLRRAVVDLGDDADLVDVAFVTVDPVHDTAERMTVYIQRFFEDGVALRTVDQDILAAAARAFGAGYEVTVNAQGFTDVQHTAFLYAIDSDGTIQVQWPFGMTSQDINHDIAYLLEKQ